MKDRSRKLPYVARVAFLRDLCKGKSVLDLGCADVTRVQQRIASGDHLHVELSKVATRIVGVDINQKALDILRAETGISELICHDAEKIGEIAETLGIFDVVVAAELIEHLSNPGLLLSGIRNILQDDGLLILTTPNALSAKLFAHAFLRGVDVNSDHHTSLFTAKTLANLLGRHGYSVEGIAFSQWYHDGLRNRAVRPVMKGLYTMFPHLADTLICLAAKST